MKFTKQLLIVLLLIVCLLPVGCGSNQQESIIVGSKDYTEQFILGNMLALLIEDNTDLSVTFQTNMASHVIFAAISTGALDVYVEYTGTIYGSHLMRSEAKTPDEVYDISAEELRDRFDLLMLDPLGFNNTYGLAMRADTAARYNIRTYSDLAEVSSDFIFGGSAEIIGRNDGLPNLQKVYGMNFKGTRFAEEIERYSVLMNDEAQVIEIHSTEGMLTEHDVVVLEDDKHSFPPYYGVILIRNEIAEKHPELLEVLERLSGAITDEAIRILNHKVDVLDESPRDVAEAFLRENGFIR